ncbi:MAG: helix-turn-helix transcriptional regulator [Clostridia bacterium]|nr:helix-turn-helix transcriptional regulator [Clostridia bacterium]
MKEKNFEFGNYLYELRRKRGISQKEFAKQLGITDKAISKWENGSSRPTTDKLAAIAAFFNISIDDLLSCGKNNNENE